MSGHLYVAKPQAMCELGGGACGMLLSPHWLQGEGEQLSLDGGCQNTLTVGAICGHFPNQLCKMTACPLGYGGS